MEGFNKLPKMTHFKEGGFVTKKELKSFEKKEDKVEENKDVAKDKKIVKKAFAMHDKQSHEGEKTDLSKLKKGGRAKKEKGTVKKFCGGKSVKKMADGKSTGELVEEFKKGKFQDPGIYAKPSKTIKTPVGEIDAENNDKGIYATPKQGAFSESAIGKAMGAKPGDAWPKGLKKGGSAKKYCGGKSVKKMADGGLTGAIGDLGTRLKNNIMGTPEQNAAAQARLDAATNNPMVASERARQKKKAELAASLTPDQLNQLLAAQKQAMAQQQQPQQPVPQPAPQGQVQ